MQWAHLSIRGYGMCLLAPALAVAEVRVPRQDAIMGSMQRTAVALSSARSTQYDHTPTACCLDRHRHGTNRSASTNKIGLRLVRASCGNRCGYYLLDHRSNYVREAQACSRTLRVTPELSSTPPLIPPAENGDALSRIIHGSPLNSAEAFHGVSKNGSAGRRERRT